MNRDRSDQTQEGMRKSAFPQRNSGKFSRAGIKETGKVPRWLFVTVDIVLLLFIAGVVLSVVSLFTPFSVFGAKNRNVRTVVYTLEIEDVDDEIFSALTPGVEIKDFETGETLGTVSYSAERPFVTYTDRISREKDPVSNSDTVLSATHTTKTVSVSVLAYAEFKAGAGYTVSGTRIAAGRQYALSFAGYTADAVCVNFEEQESGS